MHLWDTVHHQHGGLWVENHRRSPSSEDYLVVLNPSVVWRLMSWRMWFLPLLFFDLETLQRKSSLKQISCMIKRYLIRIDREEFTVRESDAQATIQADRRRRTEKIVPTRDVLEVGISHSVPSSVICLTTVLQNK